jgi:hypothetical protein
MNVLPREKQVQVISALVEGNSIRATVRMTGVAKNTVTKLLVDLGKACEAYHDRTVRNLKCDYVECDEIWSFVYAKERNVPAPMRGQFVVGDVYTWTAIDAESKLAISFLVGLRTPEFAQPFIQDAAARLAALPHSVLPRTCANCLNSTAKLGAAGLPTRRAETPHAHEVY